jgi:hypothetical protein
MDETKILQDFSDLPPEAQKLVADLITLLRKQPAHAKSGRTTKLLPLTDEPFIGIWQERKEMQDSNAYIRDLRRREWM